MTESSDFQPDWASPPGETIADILEERKLSSDDFARQMGQTPDGAKDLLNGQGLLTADVAKRLQVVLGTSAGFWLKREAHYRRDLARLQRKVVFDTKDWLAELPVEDMVGFGWIKPKSSSAKDREAACLDFFGAPSVQAWRNTYRSTLDAYAFRTSASFQAQPGSVVAWLRRGEITAKAIECRPWNKDAFSEALSAIRRLTWTSNPEVFIPKLQALCADCGVAVVILRAPSGCRASGATRFLSPKKALLLLSFRYLSDDHFWFSFFHEAGHLLLHGKNALFVEGPQTISTDEEEEANQFAAKTLVPPEFDHALAQLEADAKKVIKFSRDVGVAPGIVVGQMQHRGLLPQSRLNRLKRRYQWVES